MRAFPALILGAVLVAACLPAATSTPAATSSAPSVSDSPTGTEAPPSAEATAPPATDEPSPSIVVIDTPPPVEPSASASASPGPAGACSGSDENRDFFRAAAAVLSWTVYCAVLPAGWFVDSGQYRQASGGWVQIAYRGPGGARLEIHEGAFCTASDGCVPSGTESGDAPFGDKTGTFVALDDGGYAVVVDRGEKISWLVVGTGLDEAAFRAIAGALTVVGG